MYIVILDCYAHESTFCVVKNMKAYDLHFVEDVVQKYVTLEKMIPPEAMGLGFGDFEVSMITNAHTYMCCTYI